MNKSIYNIGIGLLLLAGTAGTVTSCSKDDESNPTLKKDNLSLVLLDPTYAQNNVLDLAKSSTINLKVQDQPAYGYTAVVNYSVEVSVDPTFGNDGSTAKSITLATTYNTANMNVDASELNSAVVKLYQMANNGDDPSYKIIPIYVRVKASVEKATGTEVTSNVVKLPQVTASYIAELPSQMYLSGSSFNNGKGKEMGQLTGDKGAYYTIAYLGANSTMQWGDSEDTGNGYKMTTSIDDQAGAGLSEAEDGSFLIANAGWYTIYIATELDQANNMLISNMHVYPAAAYVIGEGLGGTWNDEDPNGKMTMPSNGTDPWTFSAFTGSGELRAYIKVPGIDWWKTEFTIVKKFIFFRGQNNISNNWAGDVGSDYSVTIGPGNTLSVDFNTNAAEVK